MGRNKRPTIPTEDGPDNRTIPTAAGGPPNEVTTAAIVVEFKSGWLLETPPNPLPTAARSSLFKTSVFSNNQRRKLVKTQETNANNEILLYFLEFHITISGNTGGNRGGRCGA